MKKTLILALVLCYSLTQAQTKDELKALIAPKKDSIAAIQARADALQAQIDALPGWRKAIFGTIGGSVTEQRNAFTQSAPDNSAGNIGFTVNGYANLIQEKFFWRNSGFLNLSWTRFDDRSIDTDSENFEPTTDIFTLTSHYGRNLSKTWAVSGLAEYRTTVLNDFNDPGYLDVGVGFTWTPIPNLIVVIHPANYNFVFADGDNVFESSLGAKIVADYTRQITTFIGPINFKTNFSAFISYEDVDNLSNWAWTNTFGYTLWKKIGVGFDFGLRSNRQEAVSFANNQLAEGVTPFDIDDDAVDNPLQTFWTLGLSYAF